MKKTDQAKVTDILDVPVEHLDMFYEVLGDNLIDDVKEIAESLFITTFNTPQTKALTLTEKANLVREMVDQIISDHGGFRKYIQKNFLPPTGERDLDIWQKFNGKNYTELAKENGLTETRVRQIITFFMKRDFEGRQSAFDL